MSVRPPILVTATTMAKAVKVPAQYLGQNINIPISAWAVTSTDVFLYSDIEAGDYATVPAGMAFNNGAVQPDADGTVMWIKSAGSVPIVVQMAENRDR